MTSKQLAALEHARKLTTRIRTFIQNDAYIVKFAGNDIVSDQLVSDDTGIYVLEDTCRTWILDASAEYDDMIDWSREDIEEFFHNKFKVSHRVDIKWF